MRRFWRVFAGATTLAVLALLILGAFNMQALADWWRLRTYDPSREIVEIASADTMTADARRLFYVNEPDLVNNALAFRQVCPSFEQTIVLGCYHSGLYSSIFIFNINDERLDGVVEVTAAHEMLHAAYDRLSESERQRIDSLLNDYFTNNLSDRRVIETIESYRASEPGQLINEMHSIFGTELANLPIELESYYKRYFDDRLAVVEFANKYADEFNRRIAQIEDLARKLEVLKQKIDSQEASLSWQLSEIEADRRRLNSLRASGQVEEYNALVPAFNAKVNAYNAGVEQLRRDIAEYNRLVQEHNTLAAELRSLYDSLDTSLKAQSTP